jgi:MerR family copper efflux transcriptional regulator
MSDHLTIGKASRLTGIPAKTIRFYEDEGLIPLPRRSESGYRLYAAGEITRLRFIRGVRLLGLDLPEIKSLLDKALDESCAIFGDELNTVLSRQLADVEKRLRELTAVREDLLRLQDHVAHCCEGCPPDQLASECNFCELLSDKEGGEK